MDWLFDTSVFITRTHCGRGWTDQLVSLNRIANFLIFYAYVMIPIGILLLWGRLRRIEKIKAMIATDGWMLVAFSIFIISCGLGHLMDVLVFSWAPYRLFTLIDIVTAISSLATAVMLPKTAKRLLQDSFWVEK